MNNRAVGLSIEKSKSVNYGRGLDYVLLALVVALSVFGALVLSSALKNMEGGPDMFIKQMILTAFGVVIMFLLAAFDYKDYKVLGLILYIISTGLLVLVKLVGYGGSEWGSDSWLKLPIIGSFQPSEIAKITFIMVVGVFLARIKDNNGGRLMNITKLLIYAAIPLVLILLQPDFGTALSFIFIFIVMVYVAGLKLRYFLLAGVTAVPVIAVVWTFFLNEARRARILVYFQPNASDGSAEAYQLQRSLMTIGSGKLNGAGLYQGVQSQKGFVPVKESDFIMTVAGEELGFIGMVAIVVLFVLFLIKLLSIAKKSRDSYGAILVAGVTGMFAYHFIQNVGMSIGLMPITGIPLPFFSYGSSAMLTNYIAIGVALSVSMRRDKSIFKKKDVIDV